MTLVNVMTLIYETCNTMSARLCQVKSIELHNLTNYNIVGVVPTCMLLENKCNSSFIVLMSSYHEFLTNFPVN